MDKDIINSNIKNYGFLGKGCTGKVYLMTDGRALKIFKNVNKCRHEYDILKSVEGSVHFPKAYECFDNYMIRDYVGGINGYIYIEKYGITREFVLSVIQLIDDLEKLGFTKLDVRFPHLFIQNDNTIMLIDPRKNFTVDMPYPKSLLRSLRHRGMLPNFLKILMEERFDLYEKWINFYLGN